LYLAYLILTFYLLPDQKHSFIIATNQPYREVCIASTTSEYEKAIWMKTLTEVNTQSELITVFYRWVTHLFLSTDVKETTLKKASG